MDINTYGAMPGNGAISVSVEAQVYSGPTILQLFGTLPIGSAAVDAGSSPTSFLRPGLLLGRKTSDGLLYQYNPVAVDGTEVALYPLAEGISMLSSAGVVEIKQGHLLMAGIIKASAILNLDLQARRQLILSGRFFIDDDTQSKPAFLPGPLREVDKATNYQVLVTDNGTLFTASAAANFTLPAIAQGLAFEFLNMADSNMAVVSTEGDNIVWDNDASCDSLAFSTTSHKIGGRLRFRANAAGSKWHVENLSPATCTVTAAT